MPGYVCGCDVGSTFGKAVIMDLDGTIVCDATIRSKINPEDTSDLVIAKAIESSGQDIKRDDIQYLVGTGYGRTRILGADENISEISCHAMGVHHTNPGVHTILDIGGQDIKAISLDDDGQVDNFAMNDKCAAGTGRFFENMARVFDCDLNTFSDLSLRAKEPCAISSQCGIFAETEVISLFSQKRDPADVAAGIQVSVAKRCRTLLKSVGTKSLLTMTGGCAKNAGLRKQIEAIMNCAVVELPIDPQLMGAIGAAEFARRRVAAK